MTCLALSFGDVLGVVVGVLIGLGGLATALLCAMAIADGAWRRGSAGLVAGLVLLGVGLWLVGAWG